MKDKKDKENKSEKKISIFEKTGIKGGLLVLPVICFAVMMVCLCYGVVNFVTQRYPEIKLVVGNEPVSSAESLEEITGEGSDTMETETEPPETETETETETESRTEPYTPSTSKPQSSYTPKPKPQATEPVTEAVKHVAPEYSTYWSGEKNITYVEGELPTLGYESQFATLNVEGWSKKNLKVYVGDSDTVLEKGVGMWIGSYFPGQGGKTVFSAHTMSYFYNLQDTSVGAKVTLETDYGTYIYRVTDVVTFHETAQEMLYDKGEGDVLVMYTCYPRSLARTDTRIAAVCVLVEGQVYS